jgi:hypothetical protein
MIKEKAYNMINETEAKPRIFEKVEKLHLQNTGKKEQI